jgi:hypothetical protein
MGSEVAAAAAAQHLHRIHKLDSSGRALFGRRLVEPRSLLRVVALDICQAARAFHAVFANFESIIALSSFSTEGRGSSNGQAIRRVSSCSKCFEFSCLAATNEFIRMMLESTKTSSLESIKNLNLYPFPPI